MAMIYTVGSDSGLTKRDAALKRGFDLLGAIFGLALTWWLILLAWIAATIDTHHNGLFIQQRIGRYGKPIKVVKIRTMKDVPGMETSVTRSGDPRITRLGAFFRRFKIDELPQLLNVLIGDMSLVGPRPDVPGFADKLTGEDAIVLSIRPGITGPATIKYRDEESLLESVDDPEQYNREVIWQDKVCINREYIRNWRLRDDLKYIWRTLTRS